MRPSSTTNRPLKMPAPHQSAKSRCDISPDLDELNRLLTEIEDAIIDAIILTVR